MKSTILMVVTFIIAMVMLLRSFIMHEPIAMFLLIFFGIGIGLGLLRLLVNGAIKKMKGKSWTIKIVFFAVLLGLGLPFQNWFRNVVKRSRADKSLSIKPQ